MGEFANEYFEGCAESPFMQKTYYLKSDKLIETNNLKLKDIFKKLIKKDLYSLLLHMLIIQLGVQTISEKGLPIYKLLAKFV